MQTRSRLLDDLARVSTGAASTLLGIKNEVTALVRGLFDRLLADRRLVDRDEFEAVKAMAAKARAEQERLETRVAALEAKAGGASPRPAGKTKPRRRPR